MKSPASFVIAVLLGIGPSTWCLQNTGGSSASSSSSQDAPAAADKSQNSTDTSPTANTNQGEAETKANETTPAAAEKPASPKSTSNKSAAPNRKHRSRSPKPAEVRTSEDEPRKVVIHRGGISEPVAQIVPGMPLEEAQRQRQQSEDLLAAAESDLKTLASRNLNSSQQETVSQIRHYMDVAREALKDGDIQRAHTLAQKAELLSNDLVKH